MLKEFKEFALKGNLVDMAIAFVMGGAFGKVTSSFIDGMVMPLVGMIQGKDFTNLYMGLNDATREASAQGLALAKAKELGPVVAYGEFISVFIQFVIVAFVMFLIIKAMNKMKKEEPAAPAGPTTEGLLEDILSELRKR
ncbi:MAG: large conductance mechanosensitive channel protein MscL [Chitinophagales bacterium]|nr:large conductance mechanosensitive channel protein MscL [Chitinophagales bacterium]